MVIVRCPIEGCQYETDDRPVAIVLKLLDLHAEQHRQESNPLLVNASVVEPKLDLCTSADTWNYFKQDWPTYKRLSGIDHDVAAIKLYKCCSKRLRLLLLYSDPELMLRSEQEVLGLIESIAVNTSMYVDTPGPSSGPMMRATMLQTRCKVNDESIDSLAVRVRGKTETCNFKTSVQCSCGNTWLAYRGSHQICHVRRDISDVRAQRDVLGVQALHKNSPANNEVKKYSSENLCNLKCYCRTVVFNLFWSAAHFEV